MAQQLIVIGFQRKRGVDRAGVQGTDAPCRQGGQRIAGPQRQLREYRIGLIDPAVPVNVVLGEIGKTVAADGAEQLAAIVGPAIAVAVENEETAARPQPGNFLRLAVGIEIEADAFRRQFTAPAIKTEHQRVFQYDTARLRRYRRTLVGARHVDREIEGDFPAIRRADPAAAVDRRFFRFTDSFAQLASPGEFPPPRQCGASRRRQEIFGGKVFRAFLALHRRQDGVDQRLQHPGHPLAFTAGVLWRRQLAAHHRPEIAVDAEFSRSRLRRHVVRRQIDRRILDFHCRLPAVRGPRSQQRTCRLKTRTDQPRDASAGALAP